MKSKFLSLSAPDWLKGVLVAVLSTILPIILQTIQAGSLTFDWKAIGTTALSAGLAYLMKNFFSNSNGTFAAGEPQKVGDSQPPPLK